MQITQILLQAWIGFFSVCIECSSIHILVTGVQMSSLGVCKVSTQQANAEL